MPKLIQRIFLVTMLAIFALSATACDEDLESIDKGETKSGKVVNFADSYNKTDTWLIELYLCGSDLESGSGAATDDLQEIMNVQLPENVKFLIQTGGSSQWQNNMVSADAVERYVYSSKGLECVDQQDDADMGDVNTLTDFIRYGSDNFDADHRVFIFWDHGGGSVYGICSDERTGHALSLDDVRNAFTSVYQADANNPPFEIIGFDACLMATFDTLSALDGLTRFVTASEEVEPGIGWNYEDWVAALAENPAMGGAALGKVICDTYLDACEIYGVDNTATLSVIDMSKLPTLRAAYENFALEAIKVAQQNPRNFFSQYGRGAAKSENYGGNTRKTGYTNMVDIVDLAKNNQNLLPNSSGTLINAIDDAVVYKVNGVYRTHSGGLSGFHSYNGGEDSLAAYVNLNVAPFPQKALYYYQIYGDIPEEVLPMLEEQTVTPPPTTEPITLPSEHQEIFDVTQLEDMKVDLDKDNNATVHLTQDQMDLLSSVHCQLIYMSLEDDLMLYLGSDSDINADWDTGTFTDNFRGVWPMLNGHPVYVEITEENDGYNLYSIPIKLNGVECNLQVAYVYAEEKYYILGARKGLDNNGMSDRNLIKLKDGDEITTLHYAMTISGDDEDFTQVEAETFTINANPEIKDEPLGDGNYAYAFEFINPNDDSALSNFIMFTVKDDEIYTDVDVQ
ncbi:MAG: clostripain [Selenomonadaceae bacterium]|nr:clostripain [Selenomonadaceae bacterium]